MDRLRTTEYRGKVISTIEDRTLVRAQLSDLRIKTLQSLRRKAARDGCKAQRAITHSGDLIGGRVVCNNTEDVYRFVELLKERLHGDSGAFDVQDWIANPNDRGYRALHVNFLLDASEGVAPELVPCEVQIRTRLQDAWAELTHDDIYKQPDLPKDLRARSSDLAVKSPGAEQRVVVVAAAAPGVKESAPAALGNDLHRLAPGTVFRDCSECPEMVVIPPGRFEMGSPETESGRLAREGPVHSVAIRSAFGASNRRDRAIPARHPGQSREKE